MTEKFVTLPREVVEQAVEALFCTDSEEGSTAYKNELKAVKKLRAALKQQQGEQEPVAWMKTWDSVGHARTGMKRVDLTPECETWLANMFPVITPLYTHPQPPRQPLTDEAEHQCPYPKANPSTRNAWLDGWEAAERAHGIGGEV